MPITTSKAGASASVRKVEKNAHASLQSRAFTGVDGGGAKVRRAQSTHVLQETVHVRTKPNDTPSVQQKISGTSSTSDNKSRPHLHAWEESGEPDPSKETPIAQRSLVVTSPTAVSDDGTRVLPRGVFTEEHAGDLRTMSTSRSLDGATGHRVEQYLMELLAEPQEAKEVRLNKFIGIVIIANALFMGFELDLSPDDVPVRDRLFWFLCESLFITIFVVEIGIRAYWERSRWPISFWNWLDFSVVSVAVVETWILSFLIDGDTNLGMLTLLRMVRLVRLVRVVRLVRMFKGLFIAVCAFKEALSSIAYIGCIMVGGIYICALFTTLTIGRSETLSSLDLGGAVSRNGTMQEEHRYTGEDRFGSVTKSMYSLFELMTLEGWEQVGRPLVMAEPSMAIFLFIFIMVFTFGILNMIVAMVVEKTLVQAKKSDEDEKGTENQQVEETLKRIQMMVEPIDQDRDGKISRQELEDALAPGGELQKLLESMEITAKNALDLYDTMDTDERGEIQLRELLEGFARVKGAFNPEWDFLSIHASLRVLTKRMDTVDELCERASSTVRQASKTAANVSSTSDATSANNATSEVTAPAEVASKELTVDQLATRQREIRDELTQGFEKEVKAREKFRAQVLQQLEELQELAQARISDDA